MSTFEIRPYHPTDLTALYRICLGTGDSGQDATHLYNDPDVIGHYYAAPYAVLEPELAFVLTHNGHAIGYVLGAADTAAFGHRCETEWFPPLRARYAMPAEDDTSRDANMIRAIYRGHRREENDASYPAHLHIDILPAGQGMGWGKRLIQTLTDAMCHQGIPGVYLGVGRRNANAVGFYQHVGFHTLMEEEWGYVFGMRLGA